MHKHSFTHRQVLEDVYANAFFKEENMSPNTKHSYFTPLEKALWLISAGAIILSYCAFDRTSGLTLAASLIGVTSLLFSAKGNPIGQALIVVFSRLYGIISWQFRY